MMKDPLFTSLMCDPNNQCGFILYTSSERNLYKFIKSMRREQEGEKTYRYE